MFLDKKSFIAYTPQWKWELLRLGFELPVHGNESNSLSYWLADFNSGHKINVLLVTDAFFYKSFDSMHMS